MTIRNAVILVGGYGTRMRPLSLSCAKPLIPLNGIPLVQHQIRALANVGVDRILFAISSNYAGIEEDLAACCAACARPERAPPTAEFALETEPLGTGGVLLACLNRLDGPFFMLNGDILYRKWPFGSLIDALTDDCFAAIAVHQVEDARPFGLIERENVAPHLAAKVISFKEKPSEPLPGSFVNGGVYLLTLQACAVAARLAVSRPASPAAAPSDLLAELRLGAVSPPVSAPAAWSFSIERLFFPVLALGGRLKCATADGNGWIDVAGPAALVRAGCLLADRVVRSGAVVADDADLAGGVGVSDGAIIGSHAKLRAAQVMRGAVVGAGAVVERSVIAWDAVVGAGAVVVDSVVCGTVADGARLDKAIVFSHVLVNDVTDEIRMY